MNTCVSPPRGTWVKTVSCPLTRTKTCHLLHTSPFHCTSPRQPHTPPLNASLKFYLFHHAIPLPVSYISSLRYYSQQPSALYLTFPADYSSSSVQLYLPLRYFSFRILARFLSKSHLSKQCISLLVYSILYLSPRWLCFFSLGMLPVLITSFSTV